MGSRRTVYAHARRYTHKLGSMLKRHTHTNTEAHPSNDGITKNLWRTFMSCNKLWCFFHKIHTRLCFVYLYKRQRYQPQNLWTCSIRAFDSMRKFIFAKTLQLQINVVKYLTAFCACILWGKRNVNHSYAHLNSVALIACKPCVVYL